jgi:hypothetical protein
LLRELVIYPKTTAQPRMPVSRDRQEDRVVPAGKSHASFSVDLTGKLPPGTRVWWHHYGAPMRE